MSALTRDDETRLLTLVYQAIEHGLNHGRAMAVRLEEFPAHLGEPAATFVTLYRETAFQGCIGSLEARRPLAADVAHNAYASAFHDRRGRRLSAVDLPVLRANISVLSKAEPIAFSDEEHLRAQLRPGIDGLILEEQGGHVGTLLPSVWKSLPTPQAFLDHVKLKAGLAADHWSPTVRVSRYTTHIFGNAIDD